jgi:hypothetical protein
MLEAGMDLRGWVAQGIAAGAPPPDPALPAAAGGVLETVADGAVATAIVTAWSHPAGEPVRDGAGAIVPGLVTEGLRVGPVAVWRVLDNARNVVVGVHLTEAEADAQAASG